MNNIDYQKTRNISALIMARKCLDQSIPHVDYGINWEDWRTAKDALDKMISELFEKIQVEE